jgi:PAS domain S-box-containing protein
VRADDGAIVAFLNIAVETTARVLAEREVQAARRAAERAEHQLREVFAQAPAFMAVLRGPDHVFEFANEPYRTLVGGRDVVGKRVEDVLPEVVEQGFVKILDDVLRTNQPYIGREVPVMLASAPGKPLEERYVDFVYQPLADADGKPTGIVAHGSDVTEAVRARRVIEESERRYRFLANAIPVQVWTATPEGALDYVSDRAAQYFGKTAEEVVGDQWLSSLHPDDMQRTLDRWRQSLDTGMPYEIEFRLFHAASKEYRWFLARATAERDPHGVIVRWVGTNTEIEDRKRAEAELERLTKEATEANNAKSAFLASMSHELRTPLNAIGGYAQLLEMGVRGPVNEAQRTDLLKIQRSKNHLDALVSDVLNFAKLNVGRVEYKIVAFDVQPVVAAVVDMIAPQATAKHLDLVVEGADSDARLRADEDKVRQILLNLLGNAVKFTPEGGTITVSVRTREGDVSIKVTDTGIGIPRDQLDRVFEPFVQVKSTLSTNSAQGVGLGLAISRQLARAMGGDVTATSEAGHGATFTVTLPRER